MSRAEFPIITCAAMIHAIIVQRASHFPIAQVSMQDIRQAQRAEKEQEKIKKSMKARMDFLDFD